MPINYSRTIIIFSHRSVLVPDQRSDDKGPEITSARFADLLRVDRKFHSPDGDT